VVEEISQHKTEKLLNKCPYCGMAGIKARQTKSPRYKCYKCKGVFEEPATQQASVTEYQSRHDAAWTSLDNLLAGADLRQLCEKPKSQLSMRPLRWNAFQEAVTSKGGRRAVDRVIRRAPDFSFPQGYSVEIVRVRRGQREFREHLLDAQGASCAFTGEAPARVLEAGHLYSYAELGIHHEHGGLLLRRDIHRLFDDGWLAVDPGTLKVDVSVQLETFPQYASLHDRRLLTHLRDSQVEWLAQHWAEHRGS
jgi:ribosomal protein S27AE